MKFCTLKATAPGATDGVSGSIKQHWGESQARIRMRVINGLLRLHSVHAPEPPNELVRKLLDTPLTQAWSSRAQLWPVPFDMGKCSISAKDETLTVL